MLRRRMMMAQGGVSLPAGYTKIEYLESDGTTYIDTGFKPNQDTRVVMDVHLLSTTTGDGYPMAFGVYTNNTNRFASFWNNSKWQVWLGDSSSSISSSNIERCVIDLQNGQYTVGSQSTSVSSSSFSSNLTLYLLAMNQGDVYYVSAARIYSCRIYDNGALVRDFIPCTNPDGISGLWDSVNDVFYKLLPADYTRLDFIESDGTTYIDTGFKPNQDTRVVMEASLLSLDGDQYFYGAKDSGSTQSFVGAYSDGAVTFGYANSFPSAAFNLQIEEKIVIDQNREKGFVNGELVATANTTTFQTPCTLYLCARNNGGETSKVTKARIYSCRIYDNGALVRDFIPAMNASGEAGLYDLKNDVWYALLPVAKPKVENKISTWNHILSEDENYIYYQESGLQSEYPVTSDIKITTTVMYFSQGSMRPVVRNPVFTIPKGANNTGAVLSGGYYEEISASFNISTPIISITPTEDDTYIYTF